MQPELLSLHRNEYYYEHSPQVRHLLEGPVSPTLVSSYASRQTLEEFISSLADSLKIPAHLVTLYHGAEDALFKMLSWAASKQMRVHTTSWGWAEYMRMMQGLELEVIQTPLVRRDDAFAHPTIDFTAALAQSNSPALVLLASPNNPTGHTVDDSEIIRLAELFPQHMFLVDQVYTPFTTSTFAPLSHHNNVITLGSFSKFFGLPGLRCGFAVGRVPAVQSMALGPAPWSLRLCSAAMQDLEHYQRHWEHMQQTASNLQNYATPSGRFIQTAAPFVLFRCDPKTDEPAIVAAQLEARVKGKVLTAQGELYVRWSLGSPEAEERIRKCIQTLEKQANY